MCTCKNCEFGILIYSRKEPKEKFWFCSATDDILSYENGMDNDLGCDLYVETLDDHKTEERSA